MNQTIDCRTDLKPRLDSLISERTTVEEVWNDIDTFVDPLGSSRRQGESTAEAGVNWKRPEVWDSTAIDSSEKMAAACHAGIVPSNSQWLRLQFEDKELANSVEGQTYLDKITERLWGALQASDFDAEVGVNFSDLVRPGTTALICEPRDPHEWRGLDFQAPPIREIYFEEDAEGQPEYFYRRRAWTAVQILSKFREQMEQYGEDIVPETIRKAATKADGEKFEIVFCVFPRRDRQRQLLAEEMLHRRVKHMKYRARMLGKELDGAPAAEEPAVIMAPEERPWGAVWFLLSNGERVGVEDGYYEMPAAISRFSTTANSRWGHSPTTRALPTIKYINAFLEATLTSLEKDVDPPLLSTLRGLLGSLDHSPGAVNVVDDIDGVKPMLTGGAHQVAYQFINDMRGMIRQLYRVDELELKNSPQMTATEAQIRYDLMQRALGPTLGSIQTNLISRIVKIALGILARQGQLPEKPPVIVEWEARTGKRAEVSIEYLGPFARAQRIDQVAAIERGAAFVAGLLKMGFEEVRPYFRPGQAVREAFKRLGVPAEMLETEANVTSAERKAAAQKDAMIQAEIDSKRAGAARDGAQAMAALPPQSLPIPAQPEPLVSPTLG